MPTGPTPVLVRLEKSAAPGPGPLGSRPWKAAGPSSLQGRLSFQDGDEGPRGHRPGATAARDGGAPSRDGGPRAWGGGPSVRDGGPGARDGGGWSVRDGGPGFNGGGPSVRDGAPGARDAGAGFRDAGPAPRHDSFGERLGGGERPAGAVRGRQRPPL